MSNKKKIRDTFRTSVFQRDKNTCQVCYKIHDNVDTLDAHHITDRSEILNGGYVKENGISLCKEDCHMRCEKFHISNGTEWEEGLHPDDLYKKINSSKELATIKSNEL